MVLPARAGSMSPPPVLRLLLLALVGLLSGCGDDPPVGPTPIAPAITCPSSVSVTSNDGRPTGVAYAAPTTFGGAAPVTVVCTPASGSTFQLGTTTVSCVATDRRQRSASCGFQVTVTVPPFVRFTRYVAFGDSITEGQDGTRSSAANLDNVAGPRVVVPYARSYPGRLQEALRSRYTGQLPTVENRGVGGETTSGGLARLPAVLAATGAEVLLLLEGANDISGGEVSAVETAAANLRVMVPIARLRGVVVFLATLPPQREGGRSAGGARLVVPLNTEIRKVAVDAGAILVDVYGAFDNDLSLISDDGLHPNENGFQRIADAFLAAIRVTLEMPFPTTSTGGITPIEQSGGTHRPALGGGHPAPNGTAPAIRTLHESPGSGRPRRAPAGLPPGRMRADP